MTFREAMERLKSLGTEQNRKVYARHGVGPNQFGVSFKHLGGLQKEIGIDHELASELWNSGNHDARILATKIADPARTDASLIDRWRRPLDNYVVVDLLSHLAAQADLPLSLIDEWCESDNEWTGQLGWNLVAHRAMGTRPLPDAYFAQRLARIEREIHTRKNYTRHAMNGALMAIGLYASGMREAAVAAAKRIGKVEVDHGETSCVTPDAVAYIARGAERADRRLAKQRPTGAASKAPSGSKKATGANARSATGARADSKAATSGKSARKASTKRTARSATALANSSAANRKSAKKKAAKKPKTAASRRKSASAKAKRSSTKKRSAGRTR